MIASGDTPLAKALREQHDSRLDPAVKTASPPNFGEEAVPHIVSFSGLTGAVAKVYRNADQAIAHSLDNARFMRNDIGIMESLEQRMRLTALLDWHLEPDDPKSHEQKELCEQLTKLIQRTRRFTEMRRCLLEALWYGRYAVQYRWRRIRIAGKEYVMPAPALGDESPGWKPIHGDKLVFRYSDEPLYGKTGELLGPVGVQVNIANLTERMQPYVHQSEHHMAYFFPHWQRSSLAIHKHMIEDSPYESPFDAGAIHGVGIRSRIYWEWFQKQEILAFLMEFLERSAMGIEIWEYPMGNPEAEAAVRNMATQRSGSNKNVILFPKPQDPEAAGLFDVRHVEPGMAGAQALQSLLETYYGHRIKRYILGQILSSEAEATGLGSGVADIHLDTLMGIVRYDAANHDETMTHEFVEHVKNFNFPHAADIHVRFVSEIDTPNVAEQMEGFRNAWDMGARLKESDVLDMIGAAVPQDNDVVLQNRAAGQQPDPMGNQFPGADIPGGGGDETQQEELADSISQALGGQTAGDDGASLTPERYSREAADRAAAATDTEPTDAQKQAGNYRKGSFWTHGFEVKIENPAGSQRTGRDSDGNEWSIEMPHDYGYLKRTIGADGDQIDAFIGPDPDIDLVFVVDQIKPSGEFDEHKLMLGFRTESEALKAYQQSYRKGWKGFSGITGLTWDQLRERIGSGELSKVSV